MGTHSGIRATVLLMLLGSAMLSAADDPSAGAGAQPKSTATVIYEKIVATDTKDALRAYQDYQAALDKARDKVLKALQKAEADLNDVHKYTDLSITDRAKAIDELQAKEKLVKSGALGEGIADDASGDPLGVGHETPGGVREPLKSIVGTWDGFFTNKAHEIFDIDANLHVHVITSTLIKADYNKVDFDLVYADGKFTGKRPGLIETFVFDAAGNLTASNDAGYSAKLTRLAAPPHQ
jgi:hypothetical protein